LKSFLRKSKCDKSTLRKVELIFLRGFYRKPRRGPVVTPGFHGGQRLESDGAR
jgi:hypothetical protein